MEENRALHLVDRLRDRGVDAHVEPSTGGMHGYAVRVVLPDGREAIWGSARTDHLEAEVFRDGMLVGLLEEIPGSEHFTLDEAAVAIAATDYDTPVATRAAVPPPPGPPLRREGGVFRRFLGGFREE